MDKIYIQVADVLIDIENELRQLSLWDAEQPSEEALASTQPFAIDTLTFPQWLQFIFLPRMHAMVTAGADLPHQCGIAPMAEEYFKELALNSGPVIKHLYRIDEILSSAH